MDSLRTCKLFGVVRAVIGIEGALPLIHGPSGCFYHIKYLLSLRSSRYIQILTTEMDQNDVVFGAEEKLSQRIKDADKKYSPQLIVVLTSCASSIIGENVSKIIDDVKDDLNADVICINSGGFEGNQIEGYKECLSVLVGLMDEPQVKEGSINLVGQYRGGPDLKNIKNYLERLGIYLNSVLTSGSTLQEIKNASNAALNVSMCEASGVSTCELMKKKFGTPFIQEVLPLGVRNTSNYFQQICKALNKDYTLIKDENEAKNEINKYNRFLNGNKVLIVAGATRAIALVDFLSELGMQPILICLDFEGICTDYKLRKVVKRNNLNPIILKEPEYPDILKYAKDLKPDIILGGMAEIGLSKELKIPLIDVMHAQKVTLGFNGAIEIAKNIKETLKDN
jgi:light-independent protochlorophyllide reductase B subunit